MTLVVLVIAVIVEATFVVAMEIIMRREYSEEYKISHQLACACESVFFSSIIASSAFSTSRVPESAAGDGRGKRRGGGGGGGRGEG